MISILMLAGTLASACVHKPPHKHFTKHPPVATCVAPALPYAGWEPRENEDTLSDPIWNPVVLPPVTRYLPSTETEPCHVYSSADALPWPTTGGRLRAPEMDLRGGVESVTILVIGLLLIDGRKKS